MMNSRIGVQVLGFLLSIGIFQMGIAADIPLNDVPPLYQVTIFKSEIDSDHYIILAKDGIYGDTGNWYVLNWKNGIVTSPKLKKESFHWFGGGFDFKFESGEWLYIPGGNSDVTAPGATREIIPAGLIDPKSGREPLQNVPVTKELIEKLALTPRVAPDVLQNLDKLETDLGPEKSPTPNENVVLVIVSYDSQDEKAKDLGRELKGKLEVSSQRAIYVNENYTGKIRTLYIWAFESQIPVIEKWAVDDLQKKPTVMRQVLAPGVQGKPVDNIQAFYDFEMITQLPSLLATIEQFENSVSDPTYGMSPDLVGNIAKYLRLLESMINKNKYPIRELRDSYENSDAAQEQVIKNFIEPIEIILTRTYDILHKINTPLAQMTLLFSGEEGKSRIKFLTQPSGHGTEIYFQTWLRFLKEGIEWVNKASPEERVGMRGKNSSGGILEQFGFLGLTAKSFFPQSQRQFWYLNDASSMFPLLIFGLVDSAVYRANFIQFVIEADKEAEKQRLSFSGEYDKAFTGNKLLMDAITELNWAAAYKSRTDGIPGFSRERYYAQAMMIISELLNTSRLTIKNSVTYLTLLDTAISLQRTIEGEYGVVPNARANTPELNNLTEQLIHLHKAVQVRMLRGVFMVGHDVKPEDCIAWLRAL